MDIDLPPHTVHMISLKFRHFLDAEKLQSSKKQLPTQTINF